MNVQNPNINQIGLQSHVTVRLYIHMVIMVLGLTWHLTGLLPASPVRKGGEASPFGFSHACFRDTRVPESPREHIYDHYDDRICKPCLSKFYTI